MNRKYSIEDIQKIVKQKGVTLLSATYSNNKEQLLWKCNCGEEWKSWSNIKNIDNFLSEKLMSLGII